MSWLTWLLFPKTKGTYNWPIRRIRQCILRLLLESQVQKLNWYGAVLWSSKLNGLKNSVEFLLPEQVPHESVNVGSCFDVTVMGMFDHFEEPRTVHEHRHQLLQVPAAFGKLFPFLQTLEHFEKLCRVIWQLLVQNVLFIPPVHHHRVCFEELGGKRKKEIKIPLLK